MNVFTKSNDATPKPNRNTFDGSFVNNLTLKMGQITPCFLKEVIPGDSFKIDATFGFNFQPFVFPVQTDMQANLHFFYVRNRALWNGWQDFITKTENLEGDSTPPYIQLTDYNRDMFETGNIGDYLGVPTVYYGNSPITYTDYMYGNPFTYHNGVLPTQEIYGTPAFDVYSNLALLPPVNYADDTEIAGEWMNYTPSGSDGSAVITESDLYRQACELGVTPFSPSSYPQTAINPKITVAMFGKLRKGVEVINLPRISLRNSIGSLYESVRNINMTGNVAAATYCVYDRQLNKVVARIKFACYLKYVLTDAGSSIVEVTELTSNQFNAMKISQAFFLDGSARFVGDVDASDGNFVIPIPSESVGHELEVFLFAPLYANSQTPTPLRGSSGNSFQYTEMDGIIENDLRTLAELPFASTAKPDGIRISALPFRAVEACYNAFYRDDRNNPLIIDGKPYYNVYVQNKRGGADTTRYHLYQRNWESDVFTSAVQSPQQGIAPLVGVTASGQMTFADEEGKTYYLQAEFGEDGHTITGIKSYSSDMPVGTLRAMVDTISTGISINDFRNVNALQRWLETNMRKGLRYKDQIEAHFGTAPTYSELDMPEFIGGMSRRVEVNKVVQTSADTPDSPMGTLAGNATILGGNGQSVTQYCDEHGWIIGFITITPKPVYSQQLNKQLLKTELLDYYFPEFAHIGFQPILNQEIAPLQCTDNEGDKLSDVFGYQRAWYEYLANVDEVHGDFRTSLKDYIIHRVFSGVPKLGVDFLTVSQSEANEVFAVQDDSDKIFGQIYFDVKMKRPLPAIGVPKLEVG